MKHVYIFTTEELYRGVEQQLAEDTLEREYPTKTFLVFEHHKEVYNPHSESVHAFIGTENGKGILVTE